MSFENLGLSPQILKRVKAQGYETATPIQAQAIPVVIEGRDILAGAQTGTGKTAAFTLPLLQLLSTKKQGKSNLPKALILAPTRELAAQVGESVEVYGEGLGLKTAIIFGGVGINPQKSKLRKGVDIVIGTPGRLLDLSGQDSLDLSEIEVLILDEADRMLDMGFIHDIRKIMKLVPEVRQTLFFSATYSKEIKALADTILKDPVLVEVARENTAAETVDQFVYHIDKAKKRSLLSHLISEGDWNQVLVFTKTKHGANRLAEQLSKDGITATAIHGNKSQSARTRALADFKALKVRVLVATDIAARGIDIDKLPHVVNYDLPQVAEDYVHRIGRTGRAGAAGHAISLVSGDEFKNLNDIEQLIQQHIPRLIDEEFEPQMVLAESKPIKPPKKKKPKKNKKPKSEETEETSSSDTKSRASTTEGKDKTRQRRPNSNGSGANRRRKPDANKKTDSKPKPKNQGNNKPQSKTGQKPKQKSKYSINKAK